LFRRFLSRQAETAFSYAEVGASSGSLPDGYKIDRTRIQIGKGEPLWGRAVDAVRRWQMSNIRWLRLYWPNSPLAVGTNVAVVVHHFGFWWSLNACRVVYVVQENTADWWLSRESLLLLRCAEAYGIP
jgi:uncharacterized protein (UPF0548 family)